MEAQRPYEKLKFYQNICILRKLIYFITQRFEKSNLRLVSQMRDAARSAKQNIREGYRKGGIREYIHYVNISRSSLEELRGDIDDCHEDALITEKEFQTLTALCRNTDYMINRYIESLHRLEQEGRWHVPHKNK
jgi:four helix bundle protein